jgi:hypothetical protein
MRDSKPGGTLRAAERLRHAHEDKQTQATSSFPVRSARALAKGASSLGVVGGVAATALALNGVLALYNRDASKQTLSNYRAIVPSTGQKGKDKTTCTPLTKRAASFLSQQDDGTWTLPLWFYPRPKGTIWTPELGKIMVCVRGKCTVVDSDSAVAEFNDKKVQTARFSQDEKKSQGDEVVLPVCAAMARVFTANREPNLEADLNANLKVEALSDGDGSWLGDCIAGIRSQPATCELSQMFGEVSLTCTVYGRPTGNDVIQYIPLQLLTAAILPTTETLLHGDFGRGVRARKPHRLARPVVTYTE